ncbi:4-(cytidine 5'-diphospho)-2-C-methyl-D-erythritol kinase [Fusibacter sp. A1]|nr:4-(cytidine 5'-diphospho)-2-C-methyl-D-erythritol kinase [Fusibacter sp. A1]RXV62609.1 4-(cytidine 5'-diphospho)-2-C-methyl-D-erythritol kinase [Fusibacter sp. A1]
MTLRAYAKINLSLDVIGKREDGYHLLEMVMQEIGIFDLVTITKRKDGRIQITSSVSYIPVNEENIAYKACQLMKEKFNLEGGYDIHIEKRIPVAAGLAGGSSNAAAVLKGIRSLEDLEVSDEELMELSLAIGSDIPFCIQGGTALAQGIGEKLTPIEVKNDYWVLLVKPSLSVSTIHVYKTLKWDTVVNHPSTEELIKTLREDNVYKLSEHMGNVLETVTAVEHREIDQIKSQMMNYGAIIAQMSGSGPSVFGLFRRTDQAKKALKNMQRFYTEAYLVRPVARR